MISHITFIVSNLARTAHFLDVAFGAIEIYSSGEKQFSLSEERFFDIDGTWVCLMRGQSLHDRTYNHVAFTIAESEFDTRCQAITRLGVEIRPGRTRIEGEGRSVYFYDYDNHLFELHTGILEERLVRYTEQGRDGTSCGGGTQSLRRIS